LLRWSPISPEFEFVTNAKCNELKRTLGGIAEDQRTGFVPDTVSEQTARPGPARQFDWFSYPSALFG
jgi:hypothetical protein